MQKIEIKQYDKTEWIDNETFVSAEKLNKVEDQLKTLTDNSIKLNSQLNNVASYYDINRNMRPVNILYLGAKNDGSIDVGAIINKYTEQFSLYLPAGIYKVTTPIILKNSLIGDGCSRNHFVSNSVTWLVSELNSGNLITIKDNHSNYSLNIFNISIKLNGLENAIEYNSEKKLLCSLDKISMYNLSGIGIYVNPVVGTSRSTFANDITMFGKAYANSCGIKITDKAYDCRLTNIEIMGTKDGIITNEIVYGSSIHIWTGCMSGKDNGEWWHTTRGISSHNKGRVYFTNLYLDSCFIPLVATNDGKINVTDFNYWEDSSMVGCNRYDGSLTWTSNCTSHNNITIVNGLVNLGNRILYIENKNTYKENLKYMINSELTEDTWKRFPFFNDKVVYEGEMAYDSSVYYKQIACLKQSGDGNCRFNISLSGGQSVDITVSKTYNNNDTTVSANFINLYHEFYYKQSGSLIKFYMKVNHNHKYKITLLNSYKIHLLDPSSMLKADRTQYCFTDEMNDTTDLIFIPRPINENDVTIDE